MRHEKTVSVSKIRHLWEPWEEDETPRISILGWFGQPGSTVKKKFGADYEQLLRPVFFRFSWAKNKFKKFLKIL